MEEFLKILGGTTLVLGALFGILGKIIVGRIFETERKKTEESLSKLKNDLDKSVHIGKAQFDHEFKLYQDIWKNLVLLRNATLGLRPVMDSIDPNETEDDRKTRRMKDFGDAYRLCSEAVEHNKPFYPDAIYLSLSEILASSYKELVGFKYKQVHSPEYWDEAQENHKIIVELIDVACEKLRQRFEEVQVV
jgi:hypothetical protein